MKYNIEREASLLANIINKATAMLAQAENNAWQSISKRALLYTIPNSNNLEEVKAVFDKLGEMVDSVSLKTWQTSYKGVLFALAKNYHNGKVDKEGVKALAGLSIGKVKEAVGWGPKPKPKPPANNPPANNPPADNPPANNPPADNPPVGNTGATAPETLPPIGKAPEKVDTLNGLYDAVLPGLEVARDALQKFSVSGTKVSRAKAQALEELAQGIATALAALAKVVE